MAAVSAGAILCSFAGPSVGAETSATPAATAAESRQRQVAPAGFPIQIRLGIARLPIVKVLVLTTGGGARQKEVQGVIFADTAGRPLYFSTTDVGCTGDCLKAWQPTVYCRCRLQGSGDWTLVSFGGDKPADFSEPLFTHNGSLPIDAHQKSRGRRPDPSYHGRNIRQWAAMARAGCPSFASGAAMGLRTNMGVAEPASGAGPSDGYWRCG